MTQQTRTKQTAIWLIVSAAITFIALVTKTWFSLRHDSGGAGLLAAESCYSGQCDTMWWLSVPRAPSDVKMLSFLGLVAAGLAIGFSIHAAVMLLKGTPDRMKSHVLAPLAGVALGLVAIFFLRMELGEIGHKLSVSWGFFACAAGLVGILIGGTRARSLEPVSAASTWVPPGAMQPVPVPGAPVPLDRGAPGSPMMPMQTQPAGMRPYPLALQMGMTRYYGHLFLAPGRLFFVCVQQGGAWLAAIGAGLGGALGYALANAAGPQTGGAPVVHDPDVLVRAVHDHPGSIVMEPQQIGVIKQTMFWRLIKWNGKTVGLPRGLGRELKPALAAWARAHNVAVKGFA